MKTTKDRVIKASRHIAVMCTAIMTLHCACELFGGFPYAADILVGIAVCNFIIVVTNYLGFCALHRAGVYYAFAVFCLYNYHKAVGFPADWLPFMLWPLLTIGATLCVLFWVRHVAANLKNRSKNYKKTTRNNRTFVTCYPSAN